jgi:hypothetical protein
LASAARTASLTSPQQTNVNAKGVVLYLNVTNNPGNSETLRLIVRSKDPASGATQYIASLGTCLFPFFIANNRIYFDINISIISNGTAAGDVESTLPLPIAGATDIFAGGREWNVSGKLLAGRLVRSMNRILISNHDATYPGGNGYSLILSGSYPI